MSCSVKISSSGGGGSGGNAGKSWTGSQRRINALAEESSSGGPMTVSTSCPTLGVQPMATSPQRTFGSPTSQIHIQQVQLSPRAVKSMAATAKRSEDAGKLLRYIDDNVVGRNGTFLGPFGRRKVVYCDYTATGRSLQFLEDYIVKEVLPYLSDTRASTSICSLQSSLFRHEARDIVRHAVGAGEQDAVLFTGQGTAGALRTLLRHLDLVTPTTVFVGPFEHHANLRPWRECGVKLVRILETREGFLDLNDLERKLVQERGECPGSRLVGYFSAASCITGVLADDVATTLLLRQHGALSIWDYTTAAPYTKMEMNPNLPGVGETTVHKDAIIFAGHKFIGGAQSPGVLVCKRQLLGEDISPEDMRDSHRYLRDPELRDESGTGGVVEAIRCGLAVQLKENLTPQAIATRQDKISRQVLAHVRTIPELILLGCSSQNVKRLPTFSFMVRHPRGTFLHHNFVCAVLNDVFGVQARGGCACAGRYAHDLMGIDAKLAKEYEALLMQSSSQNAGGRDETNAETLRPGFARLSFPYFMSDAEVGFILEALKMVATEGWKLLPQYVLNPETGEWRHHTNSVFKDRRWLGSIRYTDGRMNASERRVSGTGVFPQSHSDCLQTARNIFNRARKMAQRGPMQIDRSVFFDEKSEKLRWFMLPHEAQDLLLGHSQNVKHHVPFDPSTYKLALLEASCFGIRRLNSDVPRTGNPPVSPNSPRHRSLPALSCPADLRKGRTRSHEIDDEETRHVGTKSPATCPGSPMPSIRFAVGEAVTSIGILGSSPVVARLISGEHQHHQQQQQQSPSSPNGTSTTDSPTYMMRTRCNSLGSSSSCRVRSGAGTSSPVPIPLSPQTLASLGIATAASQARHRHCSCSSQTELNGSLDSEANGSPGRSASSLGHVPSNSPGGSCSSSFDSVINVNRLGRSSPVLSSAMSQSSEDDLRAYLKEVTKELATEIKSEIREVISQVDDALSESTNAAFGLHHPRPLEKQQHHDSFSASDIAEYLMEFSKEMASEVKSEIRCMVNSVDGLHRYSPDDKSSSGCASPAERRRITLPYQQSASRPRTPVLPGKVSELSQHDSKMSSECSSDETVIYVVKPTPTSETPTSIVDPKSNNTDEDDEGDHSEPEKTLPKIYSAVNSVSSQDSGINLSFHDSDRSVDGSVAELGRSSSAESNNSNGCCMRRPRFGNGNGNTLNLCKQNRATNDDLSEDDEIFFSASQQQIHSSGSELSGDNNGDDQQQLSMQWHCPPKNIWKPTVEAMQEFDMIKDTDRVLLCFTPNGKSSLTLLHTLHQYRFYARSKGIDFEIGVASIGIDSFDPINAMTYLKALNVPYFYEEQSKESKQDEDVTDAATTAEQNPSKPTSCTSFCEKATRAKLYALAKKNNYNVLALAQNLDDLTEGFLGSVFSNGKLRTMKAHYYIREQELRVIRPFVYVREKALKQFTENKKFTIFTVPASPEDTTQKKNEELMVRQEVAYPRLYWSLRSALRPLISAHNLSSDNEQHQQKRQQHRRPRTNSFSAVPLATSSSTASFSSTSSTSSSSHHHHHHHHHHQHQDSDETDEEPVL